MDINSIITFIVCIIVLFVIGKIFIIPLKKILKIVMNSVLGGLLIYFINLVGAYMQFHIGLNIGTSAFVRHSRNTWSYFPDCIKALT